jgi:hypothetical protein
LYPNGTSRFAVRRRAEGGTEVDIMLPLGVTEDEVRDAVPV